MATKLFRNSSHWGAFLAEEEKGRVTAVRPFEEDPDPSPMLEAIPVLVSTIQPDRFLFCFVLFCFGDRLSGRTKDKDVTPNCLQHLKPSPRGAT